MELRQIPEIQKITEYLRDMEFKKKKFGGYSLESVLDHFDKITLMYERYITKLLDQITWQAEQNAAVQAEIMSRQQETQMKCDALRRRYDRQAQLLEELQKPRGAKEPEDVYSDSGKAAKKQAVENGQRFQPLDLTELLAKAGRAI